VKGRRPTGAVGAADDRNNREEITTVKPTRPSPPAELRLQDTLRLSAEGVAKVLGDLEARVMHAVWNFGEPVPARTVHCKVIEAHPVAIHTVITVLNKLVEKGLLCRKKQDDILYYGACLSEDEFRRQMSRRAVEGILSLGPQAVAASFVDLLAERDPDQLAQLMRLIQDRMREEEG
jgi:predicted transcriptional regulator